MGRYIKDARYHIEKIKHYYKHGGDRGYYKASHNYSELSDLALRAERSKNNKNDVAIILALRESVSDMMDEMQKRAEDSN